MAGSGVVPAAFLTVKGSSMRYHGNPCWYELSTTEGQLSQAGAFYTEILGWTITDSGMTGMRYHLARAGEDMVAGLMEKPADVAAMPPMWMIYFAADDLDQAIADATAAGAQVFRPAQAVPGTGRFAILGDPQGAAFGLLEPDMSGMSDADRARAESGAGAFDQSKPGHGNWNELMSTDPKAGFNFYAGLFGWTKGETMPMGEQGDYQLFRRNGADIGAMMGLGDAPEPVWLPYFGVDRPVSAVVEAIRAAGGTVAHGPVEVPGPAYIAVGNDPQGAWFAVVGQTR